MTIAAVQPTGINKAFMCTYRLATSDVWLYNVGLCLSSCHLDRTAKWKVNEVPEVFALPSIKDGRNVRYSDTDIDIRVCCDGYMTCTGGRTHMKPT